MTGIGAHRPLPHYNYPGSNLFEYHARNGLRGRGRAETRRTSQSSPRFSKLILAGDFEAGLAVARQQVQGGANLLDVNMDEGMIDSEASMTRFLNLVACSEPEIARVPIMIRQARNGA